LPLPGWRQCAALLAWRRRSPSQGWRAGLPYVGTEHLLGALALDPGSRARRVLGHLDVSIPAVKKELECYISLGRQRRRRAKRDSQCCSFCGKEPASGVRLVAGPGVWICAECVTLATAIIAEAESARTVP
jgi:ClpX C4-type zinc finger/Clp amino terminal domain, pathogenicity island component